MARVALRLAVVSPRISADIIAAEAFPDLARRHAVTSVPTTIVDETRRVLGAPPEADYVEAILGNSG